MSSNMMSTATMGRAAGCGLLHAYVLDSYLYGSPNEGQEMKVAGLSALSEFGTETVNDWLLPKLPFKVAPMLAGPLSSAASYVAVEQLVRVDNKSMTWQFLGQLGSSSIANTAANALAK